MLPEYDIPSMRRTITDLSDDKLQDGLDAIVKFEIDPKDKLAVRALCDLGVNISDYEAEQVEILSEQSNDVSRNLPLRVVERILSATPKNKRALLKLKNRYDYETLKALGNKAFKDKNSLVFFVSPNEQQKGYLISPLLGRDRMRAVPLVSQVMRTERDKDGNTEHINKAFFFDEKIDNRRWVPQAELSPKFYIYQFETDTTDMVVFTNTSLERGEYVLQGLRVEAEDFPILGQSSRLKIKIPLFFVHSALPCKLNFKKTHYTTLAEAHSLEDLRVSMFGKFRHPDWYEDLILTFMVAGEQGDGIVDYPFHFLQIAKAGTGKTTVAARIHNLHDERQAFASGESATVKFLVPSFKGTTVSVGYLYRAKRCAVIDEFLRIIPRAGYHDEKFLDLLGLMNNMLEHREHVAGSGNCSAELVATARVFAVSNPLKTSCATIPELAEKADKAWLSRWIPYHQTSGHVAFVENRKIEAKARPEPKHPIDDDHLRGLFEFCQMQSLSVNWTRVGQIQAALRTFVPVGMYDIYDPRFDHHIACLVDGLAKLRCFDAGVSEWEIIEQDYVRAQDILAIVIASWSPAEIVMKLAPKKRLAFVTGEALYLYEQIEKHLHIGNSKLQDIWRERFKYDRNLVKHDGAMTELKNYELIKSKTVDNDFVWSPHWTKEAGNE